MVVVINGQEAEWVPSGLSPKSIRQQVDAWARSRGHIVTEIRVDGVVAGDNDPVPNGSGEHIIEVTTSDMTEFIRDLAAEIMTYLTHLIAGLETTVDMVYTGREAEALRQFHACLDGLEWTCRAVRLIREVPALHRRPEELSIDPAALGKEPTDVLAEIEAALRQGDILLWADLIQSALCPVLAGWQRALAGE